MSVKVTVHPERLKAVAKRIASDKGTGAFMASEAARGMDPYVPYRDGTLSASADTSRPFHVTYSTPYAARVYFGKNMTIHTDKHPKATKEWDQKWWAERKDDFCRSVLRYIEGTL